MLIDYDIKKQEIHPSSNTAQVSLLYFLEETDEIFTVVLWKEDFKSNVLLTGVEHYHPITSLEFCSTTLSLVGAP